MTDDQRDKDRPWKAAAVILTLVIASLVLLVNFSNSRFALTSEEDSTKTRSIECSASRCGAPACVLIYTSQFSRGRYTQAIQDAAASAKSECLKKDSTSNPEPSAKVTESPLIPPPMPRPAERRSDFNQQDIDHALTEAASKWRSHEWPITRDFDEILRPYINGAMPVRSEDIKSDLALLTRANLQIASRRFGIVDPMNKICIIPSSKKDNEASAALADRVNGAISSRRGKLDACDSADLFVEIAVESDRCTDSATVVYGSAEAYWGYDHIPIHGFPLSENATSKEKRLDGQDCPVTREAAYGKVSAALTEAIMAALSR